MRVMLSVKATDDSEKGMLATSEAKQAVEAMGRFNDELRTKIHDRTLREAVDFRSCSRARRRSLHRQRSGCSRD
jgi:hypothetical protein